ncbi:MAG: hypothetical protein V3T23_10615 [Nitrososphaerales archaeon]
MVLEKKVGSLGGESPRLIRVAYLAILVPTLFFSGVGIGYLFPGLIPGQIDLGETRDIVTEINVETLGTHSALIPETDPIMLDNGLIDRHSRTGMLTGTFSGPVTSIEQVLIDSEGRFSALIFDFCDLCTVDGKSGMLLFRIVGRGPVAAGVAEASWSIVAGTGELANLCGEGTFKATFNPDETVNRAYGGSMKFVDSFDEEICNGHLQSVDQDLPGLL